MKLTPPAARKDPHTLSLHGKSLCDDYGWLREKENPETLEYLAAENAYTRAVMEPAQPLIDTLYAEMLSHIQQTDVSVPYRDGRFDYYARTVEGKQYPIYCRVLAAPQSAPRSLPPLSGFADEEILLDVNLLAAGQAFFSIGASVVNDDGDWLAYATDNTGFRQYTLHGKNLLTGDTLEPLAERVGSVAWAADNRTLFYSVEDEETKRPYQILRRTLDAETQTFSAAELVWQDADERFNVGVGRTRDGKYLIVEAASHTTSEQWFLAADNPAGTLRCIEPRRDNIEYSVDHRDGVFFIRVNDTGRNFRLVAVKVDEVPRTDHNHWQEILPHREDVMLEDVDLFQHFFVSCERFQGLPRLRTYTLTGQGTLAEQAHQSPREISFPEPTYTATPGINREFNVTAYRYGYLSLITPSSVFQYDLATSGNQSEHTAETGGSSRRFRPNALRLRTYFCDRPGWSAGPDFSGVSTRSLSTRDEPAVCVRVWLLRLLIAHWI